MRRNIICLLTAFMIAYTVSAQDVVLEKVESGHRIEIYAKNNTDDLQEVTLELLLENVVVDQELPVVMMVPGQSKKKMVTLTPEHLKPWSYKTRVSHKAHIPEPPAPVVSAPVEEPPVQQQSIPEERPFEAGPDIAPQEDFEQISEVEEQTPPRVVEEDRPENVQRPSHPVNQAPPVSGTASTDHEGVMGPPLSTDDMPIPAKYYEKPKTSPRAPEITPDQVSDANVFEIPAESVVSIEEKEKVVIYGQPGCPRCQMAKEYFETNSVSYEYLDITTNSSAKDKMTAQLFQSGFEGGQFVMPVIYVDDIAHYSIKDLEGFLEGVAMRD